MAIEVITDDATGLLTAIYAGINSREIETWVYESEDGCFTHAAPQWQYQAWLTPEAEEKILRLSILAPEERPISVEAYAVYHARFTEMLLAHFDNRISHICVSALPERGDDVGGTE